MTSERLQLDREYVRGYFDCPRCGARRGEQCIGRRRPRETNHRERIAVAISVDTDRKQRRA